MLVVRHGIKIRLGKVVGEVDERRKTGVDATRTKKSGITAPVQAPTSRVTVTSGIRRPTSDACCHTKAAAAAAAVKYKFKFVFIINHYQWIIISTLVTTMHPFGGSPICPRCSKAVYAAEQVCIR
jgi:hypothetical protein